MGIANDLLKGINFHYIVLLCKLCASFPDWVLVVQFNNLMDCYKAFIQMDTDFLLL